VAERGTYRSELSLRLNIRSSVASYGFCDLLLAGYLHPGIPIIQPSSFLTLAAESSALPLDINFRFTISNCLYKLVLMSSLDAAFSALADPTRRAILARLSKGEATVMELAGPFQMSQPAISQHLKVLEDAGLIAGRVEGSRRPRRLAKAGIEAMDQWLAMLRTALEKNYDRLDEVLADMEKNKRGEKR
jgi:DNA-binding transcriptional ArsR family regulator